MDSMAYCSRKRINIFIGVDMTIIILGLVSKGAPNVYSSIPERNGS